MHVFVYMYAYVTSRPDTRHIHAYIMCRSHHHRHQPPSHRCRRRHPCASVSSVAARSSRGLSVRIAEQSLSEDRPARAEAFCTALVSTCLVSTHRSWRRSAATVSMNSWPTAPRMMKFVAMAATGSSLGVVKGVRVRQQGCAYEAASLMLWRRQARASMCASAFRHTLAQCFQRFIDGPGRLNDAVHPENSCTL